MLNDDGFVAGFVREAQQSEKGKQAAEALAEVRPSYARKAIPAPVGSFLPAKTEMAVIIPADFVKTDINSVNYSEPKKERKARVKAEKGAAEPKAAIQKAEKPGKLAAPPEKEPLNLTEALVRRVSVQPDEIRYVGAVSVDKLKPFSAPEGGHFRTKASVNKDGQACMKLAGPIYAHHSDRFTALGHLPSVLSEEKVGVNSAFNQAKSIGSQGRVDVRLEGVRVGTVGGKDKVRVSDVNSPTWFLYSNDSPVQFPATWPNWAPVGVSLDRMRAACVAKLIMTGEIDLAIFAMPLVEGDEISKQWKHTPKLGTIMHTDSNGKAICTSRVVGFEAKKTKDDADNFQVVVTYKEGVCLQAGLSWEGGKASQALDSFTREAWYNSETQARSAAMAAMSTQEALRAVIIAQNGKEVSPDKYDPAAWKVDRDTAILTRGGWALLEKAPTADEPVPSRKRGQICQHKNFNGNSKIWMRAKSDTCSFSRG